MTLINILFLKNLSHQGTQTLSVMQETQVRSLGPEDPLEKGMATYSNILAWRIPWTEELAGYSPWDRKELDTTERLTQTHTHIYPLSGKKASFYFIFAEDFYYECILVLWDKVFLSFNMLNNFSV